MMLMLVDLVFYSRWTKTST